MAKTIKSETKMMTEPRRLKQATYKRWKYSKRIKHPGPKLPSGWKLMKQALKTIKVNRRVFGGVLLVYAVLSFVLVQGVGSADLSATKTTLEAQGTTSSLEKGVTLLGDLFGSSSSSATASTYQTVILIIVSLAVIWVLRHVYADEVVKRIKVKDAFYKSTGPLVPFLLVLLVISLQLIPLIIGSGLYSMILTSGLAVSGVEKFAWGLLFFLFAIWSLYMLTASVFALYIVTLPDVAPLQALRSAKRLVVYRRWTIMRKLIFLPIILMIGISIIMLPFLIWLTPIAQPIFFILSLSTLIIVHSYIYGLYRELL